MFEEEFVFSLDTRIFNVHISGHMKQMYSTAQVADAIGVSKKTLLRWLYAGELPEPKQTVGTLNNRVWTEAELKRAKTHRERNYRKRS